MSRIFLIFCVAMIVVPSVGCRHACNRPGGLCRRNEPAPVKPVFVPNPPQPMPPPGGVLPSGAVLPPGAVTTPPPGAKIVPSISNAPPIRPDTPWLPGELRDEPKRDLPPSIRLYAPEPVEKPKDDKEPPLQKPSVERTFPPIGQFAEVQKGVYTGVRPTSAGFDWLQDYGVKTVIQIRLPSEDESADREPIEKRAMRHVVFEISPEVLTKEKADDFVKRIQEGARHGVFVYDEDGALAGSMWYLQQRFGAFLDDEPARINARSLGLQSDRAGIHRDMWLAAWKLANENNR
jgi:hypothetical protein